MSLQLAPEFSQQVRHWQQQHGRHDLPWQQQVSPYAVLVSELMLQQTQVATVIPYFQRWMQAFPDVQTLASAAEDQVMQLWQGLGYYARARNLHKAARYIAELGDYPRSLADWLLVPGVGRYTAGAVMSFAFNQYGPIVDGNVRRLYSRYFALEGVVGSKQLEQQLWQLAEQLTPTQHCRDFAQGLLDLGATICKARQPKCEVCPLAASCQALAQNRVLSLPTAKPKKLVPQKPGFYLWQQQNEQILLEKRPGTGIWAALWCLPEVAETSQQLSRASLHGRFSHQFTHYKLQAEIWQLAVTDAANEVRENIEARWFSKDDLAQIGLPAPIRSYIEQQLAKFTQTT